MTHDSVNALLQLGICAVLLLDLRAVLQHREVRGAHWAGRAFFIGIGIWNLVFWTHLEQWRSVAAGLLVIAINAAWVVCYVRFKLAFVTNENGSKRNGRVLCPAKSTGFSTEPCGHDSTSDNRMDTKVQ